YPSPELVSDSVDIPGKAHGMRNGHLNSGLFCIAGSLLALKLFWLGILISRFLSFSAGARHAPFPLSHLCTFCFAVAFLAWLAAIIFYVPLCLRLWRASNRANWLLWVVGTVLLVAAGSSVLFYV